MAVTRNQSGSAMSGRTATGSARIVSSGGAIRAGDSMTETAASATNALAIISRTRSSTIPSSGVAGTRCSAIDCQPWLTTSLMRSPVSKVGTMPSQGVSPPKPIVTPSTETPNATSGGIQRADVKNRVIVVAAITSAANRPPTSHQLRSCRTTCMPA